MQFVRNEHHGLFHVWELGVSLLGRIMAANIPVQLKSYVRDLARLI